MTKAEQVAKLLGTNDPQVVIAASVAAITLRAKAFTGRGVESIKAMIDQDGNVVVYDDVAGYYTRCHSLSKSAERRIRKLSAAS